MKNLQGNTLGRLSLRLTQLDLGIREAFAFAAVAHGDQKYGNEPYINHLRETKDIFLDFADFDLISFNDAIIVMLSCVLHDVIEDTEVTREQLVAEFGEDIAETVWNCTGIGANRAEKQQSILEKCTKRSANKINACAVKICDRIANMRRSILERNEYHLRKYVGENAKFQKIAILASSYGMDLLDEYCNLLNQAYKLITEIDNARKEEASN